MQKRSVAVFRRKVAVALGAPNRQVLVAAHLVVAHGLRVAAVQAPDHLQEPLQVDSAQAVSAAPAACKPRLQSVCSEVRVAV